MVNLVETSERLNTSSEIIKEVLALQLKNALEAIGGLHCRVFDS